MKVVKPGPGRVAPTCPYYKRCGSCQVQHMGYGAQLAAKAEIVADALRRIGKLDVCVDDIAPSPLELGYRSRVSFVLRRIGDTVIAGYHAHDDPGTIIDVARCPLAEAPLSRAWEALRAWWGDGAELLPPGPELRLTLRATSGGAVGLVVEGAGEGRGQPEVLLEGVDHLASIWSLADDGSTDWAVGERQLEETWGDISSRVQALEFTQVNRAGAEAMDRHVRESCADVSGARIVDAYCGFGVRAIRLAECGARVVGIDSDPGATAAARTAAIESGVAVEFHTARAEEALAGLIPAEIVILNPPRRGLAPQALAALAEGDVARCIYVSCDPATLGRDLKLLSEAAYDVETVKPFDLFPQTAHVETVVSMRRKG